MTSVVDPSRHRTISIQGRGKREILRVRPHTLGWKSLWFTTHIVLRHCPICIGVVFIDKAGPSKVGRPPSRLYFYLFESGWALEMALFFRDFYRLLLFFSTRSEEKPPICAWGALLFMFLGLSGFIELMNLILTDRDVSFWCCNHLLCILFP